MLFQFSLSSGVTRMGTCRPLSMYLLWISAPSGMDCYQQAWRKSIAMGAMRFRFRSFVRIFAPGNHVVWFTMIKAGGETPAPDRARSIDVADDTVCTYSMPDLSTDCHHQARWQVVFKLHKPFRYITPRSSSKIPMRPRSSLSIE